MQIRFLETLLEDCRKNSRDTSIAHLIDKWKSEHRIEYDSKIAFYFREIYKQKRYPDSCYLRVAEILLSKHLFRRDWIINEIKYPDYFKLFLISREFHNLRIEERLTSDEVDRIFQEKTQQVLNAQNFSMFYQKVNNQLERGKNEDGHEKRSTHLKYVVQEVRQHRQINPQDGQVPASPARIQLIQQSLENQLINVFNENKLTENHRRRMESQVLDFVTLLQTIDFNQICDEQEPYLQVRDIRFAYFGSLLNGFGSAGSDVDFTLLTSSFVEERPFLRFIYQNIRDSSRYTIDQSTLNENIRTPLLGVKLKNTNFELDLCLNNILGAVNTKLMCQYSKLHPKVQQGGVLLKLWGKANRVISKNWLSSYAVILMYICFLQRKFGLPILQQIGASQNTSHNIHIKRTSKEKEMQIFKTDVYFLQDEQTITERMRECKVQLDKTPLESILVQFWKYYSQNGEYHKSGQEISIKKPLDDCRRRYETHSFDIEDPIDLMHNPGKKVNIQDFRRITDLVMPESIKRMENRSLEGFFGKSL